MCQLQQFAGGGCGVFTMAAPAPAPHHIPSLISTSPSPEAGPLSSLLKLTTSPVIVTDKIASNNRTRRVQRRHREMSFNQRFHMELNSSTLDWSNGCGGNWKGREEDSNMVRPHKRCAKHKKVCKSIDLINSICKLQLQYLKHMYSMEYSREN